MKCLEKIVKTEVLKQTEHLLDPLQFAYRYGKVVEDTTVVILNLIHKHLEKEKSMPEFCLLLFHQRSVPFNLTYYGRSYYLTLS